MSRDRDQSIDRILRRAAHPARPAPDECPDAETLAAFADRGLEADVHRTVERHIAACDRCQALTAAMVRADSAGVGEAAPAAGTSWWPVSRAIRWLAPAAAAAFAVTLWILVPGQRTPPSEQLSEQKSAAPARPPLESPAAPPPAIAGAPVPDERRRAAEKREAPRAREEAAPAAAAPPSPAPASPPAAAEASAMRVGAAFADSAAVAIASPDPQVLWRIRQGAIIERSSDGGATWAAQQTPSASALVAGSAPAPAACWLVGRAGTVLRTVDGGVTWERIAFPESVDVTAVSASTPLAASVTLADGRRFATSDGGATWRVVP